MYDRLSLIAFSGRKIFAAVFFIFISLHQTACAAKTLTSDIVIVFSTQEKLNIENLRSIIKLFDEYEYEYDEEIVSRLGQGNRSFLSVDILAFHKKKSFINLHSMPMSKNKYSISLKSRPPTLHNIRIEKALIELVKIELRGEIIEIIYGQNEQDVQDTFDLVYDSLEKASRRAE